MRATVRQYEYSNYKENPLIISIMNHFKVASFTLIGSSFAPLALLVMILIVGWVTPGYDPVRDTISQMGTAESPYAIWLNGSYVIYGALIALSAFGFYAALKNDRRAKLFGLLLGLHALGTVLLAVFPDAPNIPGAAESKFNSHNIVSAIAYLPLIGAALLFYLINRHSVNLRGISLFGLAVIAVNMPMPVINMIEGFEPVAGLIQRLFYAMTCGWLSFVSWQIYRLKRAGTEIDQSTPEIGLKTHDGGMGM